MITTAQVLTFLLFHLGVLIVVSAYYAMATALMPAVSAKAATRFARRAWLAALLGVFISTPWAIVSVVLMRLGGPVGGVGAIIGLAWVFCGLLGGSGIALHVGRWSGETGPAAASIRGGLLITLTWLLPLIGWFFVLPLTIATGVGCLLLGLLPAKGAMATPEVDVPPVGETPFAFS